MRIALDARTIYRPNRRGTGKNLVDLYTHVARARPTWRIAAYHRRGRTIENPLSENIEPRHIEMPGDRFDAWPRWRLPFAAWRDGADVLHCPANHCPTWTPVPVVTTIHDLIPLDYPMGRPAVEVNRFEQSVAAACRHAARIITPSQYTRDRLVCDFGADGQRITVNAWAPDSTVRRMSKTQYAPIRRKYDVQGRYVLHFGANPKTEIRKNTSRVLEAWSVLKKHLRDQWTLVIVGVDQAGRSDLDVAAQRLGVTDSVRLFDFAPEADVPALLNGASVLAYPSISEGFGLPMLDAWVTKTAVLTSNRTSLPEIAGDAAHLADPEDSCAIANGLRKLMEDSIYREQLIQRGQSRVETFTWSATSDRFIQAMETAVSENLQSQAA